MLGFWALLDAARKAQATALSAWLPSPPRHARSAIVQGPLWRLLDAEPGSRAPPALLVPAPIKRATILDLAPRASLVDRLATLGWRVLLLEWREPAAGEGELGLEAYAGRALPDAAAAVAARTGAAPWLVGHSLGGTFATIAGLLRPELVRGLVLVHAPLAFAPGSSPFRDALVRSAPGLFPADGLVPGSLLSFVSAAAAPATFLGERVADALACAGDPEARARHLAVERWTLEEAALPAALVRDVLGRLGQEDALTRGTLRVAGERLAPDRLAVPLLAIASPADAIAPPAAVAPFLEAVRRSVPTRLVRWPMERGTVFAHLAAVLGPRAHARLWPAVRRWMAARTPREFGPAQR
ncbi:MAG: alpha/beta fold hydrolase [Geminicoccaceae bacterium]|nr:alpha/beta fold hydrolase [Geminicoccaceae bacterium]